MHRVERVHGEQAATAVLSRGAPAAAILAAVVCLLAAVLVPHGWWRPEIVWPVLAVCVVPVSWLVRRIPAIGGSLPLRATLACLGIVAGFTLWAGLTHGSHVILRRDAGSYALYTQWIATRHGLPVAGDVSAFGGAPATHVPGFNLGSPGFYQTSTGSGAGVVWQVTPQFLVGAPALYSLGWWLGGWTGVFWMPAVLAGLGVLAFAGAAVRLIGPRWGVIATAGLALTEPLLHTARATYSEPPALLLLMAAAGLAMAATAEQAAPRARLLAATAGALLGLAGLVRVDNLREVALLLPVCAVLAVRRHPVAVPLAGTALLGTGLAALSAFQLSRPYLDGVWVSMEPLVGATAVLGVSSAGVVVADRWRSWRAGRRATKRADRYGHGSSARSAAARAAPLVAGGVVLLIGAGLALRPLWMVDTTSPGDPSESMIASLQRQQGLAVNGLRTYAERSVSWLLWYVGPVVAVGALLTFAALAVTATRWALTQRAVPGGVSVPRAPIWLVPAGVALGSVVLTLYRPGVTPDHPWADRRFVPVVLPAIVLAAGAACRYLVRRARDWSGRPAILRGVGGAAMASMLVPAAAGTLPLAASRTEVGEPAAVAKVCAALHPGDVVAMVSDASGGTRAQNEWVQVVRGVCGRPSVALVCPLAQQHQAVELLASLVHTAGGRLVLLAAGDAPGQAAAALVALGTRPVQAVDLITQEDDRELASMPRRTVTLVHDVWLGAVDA